MNLREAIAYAVEDLPLAAGMWGADVDPARIDEHREAIRVLSDYAHGFPRPDCAGCGHGYDVHTFFPDESGMAAQPATTCWGTYKPDDEALGDHTCQCEGYEQPAVAA